MDEAEQVAQLEKALIAQAETLARERLRHAEATRDRIAREAAARIEQAEARERQSVRTEAERLVRRRVQAAEGRLGAELDRLRWTLTEAVLSNVRQALKDLARDRDRYLDVLEGLVAAAAAQLPPGDLVAEVSPADLALLTPVWEELCRRAAPGRAVALAGHGRDSLGGIRLRLADDRARVDQTFEARMERLSDPLVGAVMERLFNGQGGYAHG